MKLVKNIVSAAVAASLMLGFVAHAATTFTPEQEKEIGKIAADYLIAHPEVLIEVSKKLEARQQEEQQKQFSSNVLEKQNELLNDKETPAAGPADAKVAMIEFFDYQCIYCSHAAPVVEQVMKSNPKVRFIFKEFPIFASRWPASRSAAEAGYLVYQEKGSEGYMKYHNGIYGTGKNEGKLTKADIDAQVKAAGAQPMAKSSKAGGEWIAKNMALGGSLGLQGTPAFIIMPMKGATADNITVLPGFVSAEQLQQAIDNAGK